MARRINPIRLNNEIALLIETAGILDCTAYEAAAQLSFRPTNLAIERAHNRLLDAAGLPARR